MPPQRNDRLPSFESGVTRRTFLNTTMAGGAGLIAGGLGSLMPARASATASAVWIEKTIPELKALLAAGALTSRELTLGYIERISDLNPLLRAVIEINPSATPPRREWTTTAGRDAGCSGRSTASRFW